MYKKQNEVNKMNTFKQNLCVEATKKIDEDIYQVIHNELSNKNWEETEVRKLQQRDEQIQKIFVNFDENTFILSRRDQYEMDKEPEEKDALDQKIKTVLNACLDKMYDESDTPKRKVQILSRRFEIGKILNNFDRKMEIMFGLDQVENLENSYEK